MRPVIPRLFAGKRKDHIIQCNASGGTVTYILKALFEDLVIEHRELVAQTGYLSQDGIVVWQFSYHCIDNIITGAETSGSYMCVV